MKVLSICQPWASLIISGAKTIETRAWKTEYRGELYIHASTKHSPITRALCSAEPFKAALNSLGWNDLPKGVIFGVCELVDCRRVEEVSRTEKEEAFGDYRPGRWAWIIARPKQIEPIECTGRLGIFEVFENADPDSFASIVLRRDYRGHTKVEKAKAKG